jgi:hypothetical protein
VTNERDCRYFIFTIPDFEIRNYTHEVKMSSAIAEIDISVSIKSDEGLVRLSQLEAIIEEQQVIGQKCYVEIGKALAKIKSEKLWELEHQSFSDYCQKTYRYEKRWVNKLIELGVFAQSLAESEVGTTVPIPSSERHIRPLLKLGKDDRVGVWVKAVEELPDGMTARDITEDYIAEKVNDFHNEKLKQSMAEAPVAIKEQMKQVMEAPEEHPPIDSTVDIDDDTADTELIEDEHQEIASSDCVTGIQSKIRALPTPEQPYDFAIADARNFAEMASTAIDELTRQIKKGGRLALFCDPVESYKIVASATTYGYTLEHSLVHPKEVDPEYKGDQLWPIGHEVILILIHGAESKEQRNSDRCVERVLQLLGEMAGTTWYGPVQSMTQQLLTAYCEAGDQVLCPTGGKHFIRESLDYGCKVTYLASDPEKFAWYQGQFGA